MTTPTSPTSPSGPTGPDDAAIAALRALTFDGPPVTVQQLEARIAAIADALFIPARRARVLISSVIVAQMLPASTFVKGGIGVKLRLGEVGTRATKDVDVVVQDLERFLDELTDRLQAGWGTVPPSKGALQRNAAAPPRVAFTGAVRPGHQATPDAVPPEYLMQPYNVTLDFITTRWAKVPLEVAHDEIDGTEHAGDPVEVAAQIAAVGDLLGFGTLRPVPLISLEQQLAQKIHAATEPGSTRAHDLVDLQLLWHAGTEGGYGLDFDLLAQLCQRTFEYRNRHAWPPVVVDMPAPLEPAYQRAREEAVAPAAAAAVDDDDDADSDGDAGADDNDGDGGGGGPVQLAATLPDATSWLQQRIDEITAAAQ